MRNEFTVVYEKGEECYIGYCLEIPGAYGQGKTKEAVAPTWPAPLS